MMFWLWALLLAIAIVWGVVSAIIAAFKPWECFCGEDWWIAPVLILGWPIVFGWMAIELIRERYDPVDFLDRDEGDDRGG